MDREWDRKKEQKGRREREKGVDRGSVRNGNPELATLLPRMSKKTEQVEEKREGEGDHGKRESGRVKA